MKNVLMIYKCSCYELKQTLTSPAMNCPNPLGNVIVAMMKMTTAGYTKRLWTEITQDENLSLKV